MMPIPYIVEAEIVEVVNSPDKARPFYNCRAFMPNGAYAVLTNVEEMSMFGGIGDYFQRRARTTKDAELPSSYGVEDMAAAVGDRVYITFINGFITRPVIIGHAQHPNQTVEFDDAEGDSPRAVFQYNGLRVEIDEEGSLKVIRKGAPEVKYAPQSGAAALLGALTSAVGGPSNPALDPAPDTEVVMFEMGPEGVYRIKDANGQYFEINRADKKITIGNNGPKSTDSDVAVPSLSGAESVVVSDADQSVELMSRKLVKIDTKGKFEGKSMDAWTISSNQAIELDGSQAKLKLAQGKVGLGGPGGELLDIFDQVLQLLIQHVTDTMSPANQNNGNLGYPTVQAPAYTQSLTKLQTEITKLKTMLGTIKGGI